MRTTTPDVVIRHVRAQIEPVLEHRMDSPGNLVGRTVLAEQAVSPSLEDRAEVRLRTRDGDHDDADVGALVGNPPEPHTEEITVVHHEDPDGPLGRRKPHRTVGTRGPRRCSSQSPLRGAGPGIHRQPRTPADSRGYRKSWQQSLGNSPSLHSDPPSFRAEAREPSPTCRADHSRVLRSVLACRQAYHDGGSALAAAWAVTSTHAGHHHSPCRNDGPFSASGPRTGFCKPETQPPVGSF